MRLLQLWPQWHTQARSNLLLSWRVVSVIEIPVHSSGTARPRRWPDPDSLCPPTLERMINYILKFSITLSDTDESNCPSTVDCEGRRKNCSGWSPSPALWLVSSIKKKPLESGCNQSCCWRTNKDWLSYFVFLQTLPGCAQTVFGRRNTTRVSMHCVRFHCGAMNRAAAQNIVSGAAWHAAANNANICRLLRSSIGKQNHQVELVVGHQKTR